MHFQINNSYTLVTEATEEERGLLNNWCTKSYEYFGIDYTKHPFRRAKKTAYLEYFIGGKFPTGWVGDFVKRLQKKDIVVTIDDNRTGRDDVLLHLDHGTPSLRVEYQTEAKVIALERDRGILHQATGSGKTYMMSHLLGDIGRPAIIMVPTLNLLIQNYDSLKDWFGEAKVGRIGEGMFLPRLFTVATVQSLWNLIKDGNKELEAVMKACQVLMIEEAHHVNIAGKNKIQNSYFQIAMLLDNARWRYGLTATPGDEESLDRVLLEAATGRVIHHVSSSTLIELGYLTRPTIKIYKITCPGKFGEWQESYKRNILQNHQRNNLIISLAEKYAKEGKSVLIIVNRVENHAFPLHERIEGSEIMIGKTPTDERKELFKRFEAKDFNILVSTVVNEGVDIPSMDVVIMAGGGKSDRATVQRVGRALRVAEGKSEAIIIDFYDQDGAMMLKHSRRRIKAYKAEEAFNVLPYINEEKSKPFWK